MSITRKQLPIFGLAAFLLALFATMGSCSSDLLSSSPATVRVSVSETPTATVTYNSALVSFNTDSAVTVSVEYGTVAGTYTYSVPRSTTESVSHAVTLADLSSSTTYYYRVISYLGSARTYSSAEYSLTTAANPSATLAISGQPASSPSSDGATVSFVTTAVATYVLEYGTTSGTYTKATPRTSAQATAHNASLADLVPSTTYYYRIGLYLDDAFIANSAEYSFATAVNPGVLSIATGPTVTIPGSSYTSVTVTWTSNIACTHILEYGTVSGTYTNSTVATTTASASHSETLTGLASGTTYYCRIRLLWNGGDDYASTQFTATTASEPEPTAAKKARGIWLVGGLYGPTTDTVATTIDLFDPVTETWYPAAASTDGYTPVSFAGYAAYDGFLYVIGGFAANGALQNLTQIYNIATDTWTTVSMTPNVTARANINAAVLNGKIYVLSGTSGAYDYTAWAGTGVCYEFTPNGAGGGTWVNKTGYPATNNSERFTYAYGNVVYGIGGRSAAAAVAALAHDGYVPTLSAMTGTGTGTSSVVEIAMSTARTGVTCVVCDSDGYDSVVMIGGISGFTTNPTGCFINFPATAAGTMSSLVQYLPQPFVATTAWLSATNPFAGGIAFGSAVVTAAAGSDRIYHFGGTTTLGGGATGTAFVRYTDTPQSTTWAGSWTTLSGYMPTGRWGHGAVTLNQ